MCCKLSLESCEKHWTQIYFIILHRLAMIGYNWLPIPKPLMQKPLLFVVEMVSFFQPILVKLELMSRGWESCNNKHQTCFWRLFWHCKWILLEHLSLQKRKHISINLINWSNMFCRNLLTNLHQISKDDGRQGGVSWWKVARFFLVSSCYTSLGSNTTYRFRQTNSR